MRVWILALLVLLWAGCDSVRYGSDLCEGDECEAVVDSKNPQDSLSSEKAPKDGKSSSSVSSSSQRDVLRSSSSVKDSVVAKPITDTTITGNYTCSDGELIPVDDETAVDDDATDFRRAGVAIKGFAEKGPFRYGTSVKIVELDSLKRLADSKRTHETCIVTSNGTFNFDSVNLVSPYVRVEANGYYMNEFTASLSTSLVKLNAVVDLSKRDSFNVNILTHMAAPRVMKLVEDSGNNQPIGSQSGRALSDVLSSFGISLGGSSSGTGFGQGFPWGRGQTTCGFCDDAELCAGWRFPFAGRLYCRRYSRRWQLGR